MLQELYTNISQTFQERWGANPCVMDVFLRLLRAEDGFEYISAMPFFQICVATQGQATLQIEEQNLILQPNQAVLLKPGHGYRVQSKESTRFLNLSFTFQNEKRAKNDQQSERLLNEILGGTIHSKVVPEIFVIQGEHAESIGQELEKIFAEKTYAKESQICAQNLRLLLLFLELERSFSEASMLQSLARSEKAREVIRYSREYMKKHFMRDLTVQEVAQAIYWTPGHFAKVFREETGMSPHNFILQLRITQACALLEKDQHLKVGAIASLVGFSSSQRFNAVFRKQMGMTPKEYRQRCQNRREEPEMFTF